MRDHSPRLAARAHVIYRAFLANEGADQNRTGEPVVTTERSVRILGVPVVHACPYGDDALTPCCFTSPFFLPLTDRMTLEPGLVTCGRVSWNDGDDA